MAAMTEYAAARQSALPDSEYKTNDGKPTCWWRLRSPGAKADYAAYVNTLGYLDDSLVNNNRAAIRPALWVDLSADIFN